MTPELYAALILVVYMAVGTAVTLTLTRLFIPHYSPDGESS